MNEQAMPYAGGQPDFLSLVNAEVEKVEPVIKASPTSQEEQPPSLVPHESLPTPTERPKEVKHLKASNFTEPTLPVDWLSQSVQDYIRTVAESYGCPQDFVVAICLTTAGIAAGKKVQLATNPYTNYPCDFFCFSLAYSYFCTHEPSYFCDMFRLEATWMWQYGHDTIPDWDGKLLIVDTDAHNTLVETNALPGTVAAYGYTIVLQGWVTILYIGREVHCTKDDLIIYTPGFTLSVLAISDDYRGICLVADKDFAFESPTMRDAIHAAYLPAVELSEPRLTLAEEDIGHLMELMGIIRRYLLSACHPFRSESLRITYGLFLLELTAIQERTIRNHRFPKRMEELFFDFLRLVPIHFAEHHDVGYYASQLCITPRYLAQIVRDVSGRTVIDYINQMLLMEASYLLQQTSLPIAQIAYRLHFSETASFTRFFTRLKGMNPKEYRKGR